MGLWAGERTGCAAYPEIMSELPLDDGPDISAAAREALEEPGEDIPAEQVWAELGLT